MSKKLTIAGVEVETTDALPPEPKKRRGSRGDKYVRLFVALKEAGPTGTWTVLRQRTPTLRKSMTEGPICRALLAKGVDPNDFEIERRVVKPTNGGAGNRHDLYIRYNPGHGES